MVLTKMDLTEFRSKPEKEHVWVAWQPHTAWVGDCVRWASTVRPWQHLACSHALEESLTTNHHCLRSNSQHTPNPNPKHPTLIPKPPTPNPKPPTPNPEPQPQTLNPNPTETLNRKPSTLQARGWQCRSSSSPRFEGTSGRVGPRLVHLSVV